MPSCASQKQCSNSCTPRNTLSLLTRRDIYSMQKWPASHINTVLTVGATSSQASQGNSDRSDICDFIGGWIRRRYQIYLLEYRRRRHNQGCYYCGKFEIRSYLTQEERRTLLKTMVDLGKFGRDVARATRFTNFNINQTIMVGETRNMSGQYCTLCYTYWMINPTVCKDLDCPSCEEPSHTTGERYSTLLNT